MNCLEYKFVVCLLSYVLVIGYSLVVFNVVGQYSIINCDLIAV